jgi:hypothetical protein
LQGVDRSRRNVEGSTVMAGWLIVSLTKHSISDTDPHKRTDQEEFSPSETGFHGDCPETMLGVGMGVRMGAWGPIETICKFSTVLPQFCIRNNLISCYTYNLREFDLNSRRGTNVSTWLKVAPNS